MKTETVYKAQVVHPYAWLWEPLADDPTFVLRPMFGTKAAYVGGKLVLCFSARHDPWHGVLVATEPAHHDALTRELPALKPHPILPKWLYLPDASAHFERDAERLVALVRRRDGRIGVEPSAGRGTKKTSQRRPRIS